MALVYVTDDEPNICKLVAFGLKDEGFETATFTDGNSLLEAIQKRKPDAIILDWMMPPPDGLTICRSLRSEGRHQIYSYFIAYRTGRRSGQGIGT